MWLPFYLEGEKRMKTNMKQWVKAAGIRAVKTVAQAAVAMIGTNIVLSDVNWQTVVSASVLAGLLSLLTSVMGLPEVESATVSEADMEEDE